jgi:hypothetical protein
MDPSLAMMIFWVSGFIGFIIALISVLYILAVIKKLSGRLKTAMIFVLFIILTFVFSNLGYGMIVLSSGLKNRLILVIVSIFLVSSALFAYGAIKLLSALIEEQKLKK